MLMSTGSAGFQMPPYQWTSGSQPVALVNGAVGPVTVANQQILYPQYCSGYLVFPQVSMKGPQSAALTSYGYGGPGQCVFGTYTLAAPGIAPVLNAVYYGVPTYPFYKHDGSAGAGVGVDFVLSSMTPVSVTAGQALAFSAQGRW